MAGRAQQVVRGRPAAAPLQRAPRGRQPQLQCPDKWHPAPSSRPARLPRCVGDADARLQLPAHQHDLVRGQVLQQVPVLEGRGADAAAVLPCGRGEPGGGGRGNAAGSRLAGQAGIACMDAPALRSVPPPRGGAAGAPPSAPSRRRVCCVALPPPLPPQDCSMIISPITDPLCAEPTNSTGLPYGALEIQAFYKTPTEIRTLLNSSLAASGTASVDRRGRGRAGARLCGERVCVEEAWLGSGVGGWVGGGGGGGGGGWGGGGRWRRLCASAPPAGTWCGVHGRLGARSASPTVHTAPSSCTRCHNVARQGDVTEIKQPPTNQPTTNQSNNRAGTRPFKQAANHPAAPAPPAVLPAGPSWCPLTRPPPPAAPR